MIPDTAQFYFALSAGAVIATSLSMAIVEKFFTDRRKGAE